MSAPAPTALRAGLVQEVQRAISTIFAQLVAAGGGAFPTALNEAEQVTGVTLADDGVVVTTNRSTYEVKVSRVGFDPGDD